MVKKEDRTYICIDLKSFYASVECVERGLDPLTTNLVVADPDRTEKTICLAVSPSLKALGVKNRCRVFQIPQSIDYIMATPRMQMYIDYSATIYSIYLKYISKDDIHVYSIDEAFMDVTDYLDLYQMSAKELGIKMMQDIFETTGITATCGVGSNLYLAKVALDIMAKHVKDRVGVLDEESYKKCLWEHRPLTDFWRIGSGTAKRLESLGIHNMRQIAEASEDILYKMFGIDAELLIDHANGRETTTIADIKAFRPKNNCLTSGQVLSCGHDYASTKLLIKEMVDLLSLELVDKGLVTSNISLVLSYDRESGLESVNSSMTLSETTSSAKTLIAYMDELYDRITHREGMVHRIGISFNNLVDEAYEQYDLFSNPAELARERKMQHAMLDIKRKFGKNAILKGMNLEEGAKTIERNKQIGGHRSGN